MRQNELQQSAVKVNACSNSQDAADDNDNDDQLMKPTTPITAVRSVTIYAYCLPQPFIIIIIITIICHTVLSTTVRPMLHYDVRWGIGEF